jgi:hypothetical protein
MPIGTPTAGALETVISAATTTVTGQAFQARPLNRAFQAFVTGSGAVTATVIIEVSMDGINWATRTTIAISGTAGTNGASGVYVDTLSPFPYVRGSLTAITGTNAACTLMMSGNAGG